MKLFDAHMHIIDPRFPLIANSGYLPEPFTCDDYQERMKNYGLQGGAIVSGSFQGFDYAYMVNALKTLGPSYVGVINLDVNVTDDEILRLNDAGVRAIRFNAKRSGPVPVSELENSARRVHEICGWHVELYVDSGDLDSLYPALVKLPSLSIDHLGLSLKGFDTLLALVEKGARLKASGFGRVDFDVIDVIQQVYSINPGAVMFATDLPSTRATRPYSDEDFSLITQNFNSDDAENILYNNAVAFYRPKSL